MLRPRMAHRGTVLDQSVKPDPAPAEAGEQREVRPAVEGQRPQAPAPAPPREVAGLLVQPAMLGGGELPGRALDQREEAFAGEPVSLDAPMLGLRLELRPVAEARGRRVEEPEQAARRAVVDVAPRPRRPSRRPRRAGPGFAVLSPDLFGHDRDLGGLRPRSRQPDRPASERVLARARAPAPPAMPTVVVRTRAAPRTLRLNSVDRPAAPAHEVADQLAAAQARPDQTRARRRCVPRQDALGSLTTLPKLWPRRSHPPSSALARVASTSSTLSLIIGSPPVVRGRGGGNTAGPSLYPPRLCPRTLRIRHPLGFTRDFPHT